MNTSEFQNVRKRCIDSIKTDIAKSVTDDVLVSQTINTIDELTKVLNTLTKRIREWYSYYNPEFEHIITNHEKFLDYVENKTIKEIQTEFEINVSMGGQISEANLEVIKSFATSIKAVLKQREDLDKYLEETIKKIAPNMQAIIGTAIAAKLIEHAGSLRRLAIMPASTIQLLGAEKALFRHLKNSKSKCPKFGYIYNEPLICGAKRKDQGRIARVIADKLSIASRIDYFHGEFIGDKLRQEIEKK